MKLYRIRIGQKVYMPNEPLEVNGSTYPYILTNDSGIDIDTGTGVMTLDEFRELPQEAETHEQIVYFKGFNNADIRDIARLKRQYNDTDYVYKLIEQPEPNLMQFYHSVRSQNRVLKDNYYARTDLFYCKPCEEKTRGYVMSKVENDDIKSSKIMASFCGTCEHKYYNRILTSQLDKNMLEITRRGMRNLQAVVRIRGGGRQTLDALNGTEQEDTDESSNNDYWGSALNYDYYSVPMRPQRIDRILRQYGGLTEATGGSGGGSDNT